MSHAKIVVTLSDHASDATLALSPSASPSTTSDSSANLYLINGIDHDTFISQHYSAPLYETLSTIVTLSLSKNALNYCVKQLQCCATSLSARGGTPFIKPAMWNGLSPAAIHEAFAISSSYASRNHQNEDLVQQVVIAKFYQLINQSCWSFEDHLATMQALVLLQVILLFDGDIRMRAVAESHHELIEEKMLKLLQRRENEVPESIAISPWLRWLFMESVRRTHLMHIFVQGIFRNLKNGYCDLVPVLAVLPLSVHAESWNARSETEWLRLDASTSHLILPYAEAMPVWHLVRHEKRQKLEPLQDMLYIACKGEETLLDTAW